MSEFQQLTRQCSFPRCKKRIAYDYERAMCAQHVELTDFLMDNLLRRLGIDPAEARKEGWKWPTEPEA